MKRPLTITAVALATITVAGPALAAWTATGGGSGSSRAGSLGTPGTPTAPAPTASSGVTLSWSAATLPGGALVKYLIERAPVTGGVTGSFAAVSAGTCASTDAAPMTPASAVAPSCTDPLTTAGTYRYRVTSAAGTKWRNPGSPSTDVVVPAAPTTTATTVSPNVGGQGASRSVTITGTNFGTGTAISAGAGSGITVSNVAGTGATTRTATFAIAASAAAGPLNITVTTSTGTATCTGCFTVTLAPTLSSASTVTLPRNGAQTNVTFGGSNFATGMVATLSSSNYAVISTTVNSTSSVTVRIQNNNTGNGSDKAHLTVTNTDGGAATLAQAVQN